MENTKDFEENWPRYREQIKNSYPHLSDEELHYSPGREEELLLSLQEKLKKTREEIRNWLRIMG